MYMYHTMSLLKNKCLLCIKILQRKRIMLIDSLSYFTLKNKKKIICMIILYNIIVYIACYVDVFTFTVIICFYFYSYNLIKDLYLLYVSQTTIGKFY